MKASLNNILLLFILMLFTACPKEDKSAQEVTGPYSGTATQTGNATNSKTLIITITSVGNPVTGTYILGSISGDVSGSALGLIYSLTLKPKTAGVTYSVSATWDGVNTISGTMKGNENGSIVTYDFVLKRQ